MPMPKMAGLALSPDWCPSSFAELHVTFPRIGPTGFPSAGRSRLKGHCASTNLRREGRGEEAIPSPARGLTPVTPRRPNSCSEGREVLSRSDGSGSPLPPRLLYSHTPHLLKHVPWAPTDLPGHRWD